MHLLRLLVLTFVTLSFQANAHIGEPVKQWVSSGVITISGTKIPLKLITNEKTEVVSYGDPEIPGHGHYEYLAVISIIEGTKSCERKVEITRKSIPLCSGLILKIANIGALMKGYAVGGQVLIGSSPSEIGSYEILEAKLKEDESCPSSEPDCPR